MSVLCKWCLVKFPGGEQHLTHCRTDWHHFNMKRKLAELPPLSQKEFSQKMKYEKEAEALRNTRDVLYCTPCKKKFASKIAYDNHVQSKKHMENLSVTSEEDHEPVIVKKPMNEVEKPIESDIDDEWDDLSDAAELEDVDTTMCIFCSLVHETLSHNIRHMAEVHSFFIPDVEFCNDIGGLIGYLIVKVQKDFLCLWCPDTSKGSLDAVQKHMRDKGHCMMRFEEDVVEEYEYFYDYSSTYPEEAPEKAPITGDEYQLVLPSGNVIGNRSLMKYYKQRFNSTALALVPKKKHHSKMYLRHLMSPAAQAQSRRNVAKWNRQYTKWYMQLGTKANHLQKHFREQVNF
uniref:Putative c2h2-type zn-finger protein n=1 Tax=Nyssomyia neivai TaxID=330878 RepID=A0A1L8DCD9_9DIPT